MKAAILLQRSIDGADRCAGAMKASCQALIPQARRCEIEIVTAQQQMAAYVGAREFDTISGAVDADQREVTGAAAYVADQNGLAVLQVFIVERER